MNLDFDPVREVTARLVDQDMPVRDEVQTLVAFEEEPAGAGEQLCPEKGRNAGRCQQ
jgi:hypothetical protein